MPPVTAPIVGVMRSLTIDWTRPPKAAPMMTPMARSTMLPLSANSRNSLSMTISPHGPVSQEGVGQPMAIGKLEGMRAGSAGAGVGSYAGVPAAAPFPPLEPYATHPVGGSPPPDNLLG